MSNKQNRAQSSMTVTLKIEIDAPDLGEENKTTMIQAFAELVYLAGATLRANAAPSSPPPDDEPSEPAQPPT